MILCSRLCEATFNGRSLLSGSALGILALFLTVTGLAVDLDDPDLDRAVQNPVLWSHFETVARDSRAYYDSFGRKRYREHPDLDAHTEVLIEDFLKRVHRQCSQLAAVGERLEQAGRTTSSPGPSAELDQALKDVQKASKSLRGTLSSVYFSLNENARTMKSSGEQEADGEKLTQLVLSACRAVRGYVFQAEHTVTVHRLQNENMLSRLNRIEEMAGQLRRKLSAN